MMGYRQQYLPSFLFWAAYVPLNTSSLHCDTPTMVLSKDDNTEITSTYYLPSIEVKFVIRV